jgi:two-component system sensor histidine kinase/response regulator
MDGCVTKPMDRTALATRIESLLRPTTIPHVDGPGPATLDREVFDRQELVARVEGDEELVAEMIDAFLTDTPEVRSRLAQARGAGGLQEMMRIGHMLKGSAATLGAHALQSVAANLERAGQGEDLAGAQAWASDVDRECDRLIQCLSAVREAA